MNPEPIQDIKTNTESSDLFHHFVGGFVIDLPCILCDSNTVFVHDIYSLVDFIDRGGIIERPVKFFDSFIRGYNVTIVVQDMETGQLIKRQHRLNNDSLPCDWLLMETDYLNPEDKKDELLEFEF